MKAQKYLLDNGKSNANIIQRKSKSNKATYYLEAVTKNVLRQVNERFKKLDTGNKQSKDKIKWMKMIKNKSNTLFFREKNTSRKRLVKAYLKK